MIILYLFYRRPTFFAYFPGEPYFYSTSAAPNPKYCQALVECFYCTNYCYIPLADRDVFSLRRLRLNRDILYNNSKGMSSLINNELMNYYNDALMSRYIIDGKDQNVNESSIESQQNVSSTETSFRLPMLTKFEIRCTSKFRGDDSVFEHFGNNRGDPLQQDGFKNLAVNIKFCGSDVLNSFSNVVQPSVSNSSNKCSFFETPLPNWLKKSACRGRNFLEIESRTGRRVPPESDNLPVNTMQAELDDDVMSIAASEMTNWGGQNKTQFYKHSTPLDHMKRHKASDDAENCLRNFNRKGVMN